MVRVSGVPKDEHCRLVALARDGRTEVAGSWEADYKGTAAVEGTTGIDRGQLVAVWVETDAGRRLVTVPVTG